MSIRDQLNSYIERVEKRLRLGAWLRGAAILTSAALGATVVLVLITNALAFSGWSITGARIALVFALVMAVTFGIALPLNALNRRRAAYKAEAMFPQFKERLVTFAERDAADDSQKKREPFIELLAADTLEVASKTQPALLVSDRKLLTFLGVGAVSAAILTWMILAGPGYLGHGAALIWAASPSNSSAPFYDLKVTPGDAAVRRSADQMVTAQLIGLQTDIVHLYARYQSTSKWEQVPMHPQAGSSGFEFVFAGLPESVEYYVEAGPLRSKHFNIRVLDLPEVKNIRVTYRYPEWTHLQNVVEERGGDLRAVEGTDAALEVQTDRPLSNGILVLDNGQQIRLSSVGSGNVYTGTVRIAEDGVFHVSAIDQGQPVRLSNDYFIEAQKANPPNVIIARPGLDYRASPIEEVTVAIKASDEFGLDEMKLHYSVNGDAEKTVDLLKQKGVKEADGSTLISLEDFKMVPGDLVSYYATAKDSRAESHTEIAYIQADPFEREFSQSQAAGGRGGGGGGGQGNDNDISQREKEIIAATWKQRGDDKASKQAATEAATFLSGVQSKLRDQSRSLSGRMQSRELSAENDQFSAFTKDMNDAAEAMGPATDKLKQQKWADAIPDEQKALQHLLRAEATFRDIQVAFGNRGGGGGAGGAGRDLASLFDLELDTEKNQYESAQTAGSADQKAKEIDEALQKLDELARRQQDLAQQARSNGQSSEQRWQQEMLRREAEKLQQQMEQLAQSNAQKGSQAGSQDSSSGGQSSSGGKPGGGDPRVQQSLDQLRQATDDMRRATTPEQSEAEARRAADRLKEAQDLLGGMRQQQTSSRLGSLADETDRLVKEQNAETDRMNQLAANGGQGVKVDDLRKLADDRQKLAEDLGNLEKSLQDTSRELATNKEIPAATKLRDALGDMQQSDLRSRVQRDADWIRRGVNPNANGTEQDIADGMQRLENEVRNALQAAGNGDGADPKDKSSQQGLESALDRVEHLRNQMDTLSRNGNGPSGQGQGRQPGQQGQGGQQGAANGAGGGAGGTRLGGGGTYAGGYGNGPLYGNLDTGNNTPSRGAPVQPDNSPIPPQQTYQDSLRDLNQLRQSVQQDPEMARDVQELIREMQRLDPSRFPGNPALVEQLHDQVLATVDKLELQLRRQLDDKQSGQVRSGDSRPVPAGYEDSVAEYYRRLSQGK